MLSFSTPFHSIQHHITILQHNTTYYLLSPRQRLQRTNFKRSRTSGDGVVGNGGVATGQNDIRLAGDGCGAVRCRWDGEGETAVDGRCAAGRLDTIWSGFSGVKKKKRDLRSEDGAGDGDESAVDLRFAVRGGDYGAGGQKGDFGARGDVAVGGRGNEHGECLGRWVLADILVA